MYGCPIGTTWYVVAHLNIQKLFLFFALTPCEFVGVCKMLYCGTRYLYRSHAGRNIYNSLHCLPSAYHHAD
jgi:hypothetical protein